MVEALIKAISRATYCIILKDKWDQGYCTCFKLAPISKYYSFSLLLQEAAKSPQRIFCQTRELLSSRFPSAFINNPTMMKHLNSSKLRAINGKTLQTTNELKKNKHIVSPLHMINHYCLKRTTAGLLLVVTSN